MEKMDEYHIAMSGIDEESKWKVVRLDECCEGGLGHPRDDSGSCRTMREDYPSFVE